MHALRTESSAHARMSRIPIAISTCMSRAPAAAQEMTGSISNHFPAAETMDGHPIKRQKPYGSTYQKDLERLFSGIIGPLKKGNQYAWCVPCARDIKIYASGVNDLREHIKYVVDSQYLPKQLLDCMIQPGVVRST